MTKQMRKSRVSASQNSPKTIPKTLPNGGSQKHMIFERIFNNIFQNSKPRNLENINFPRGKSLFLRFSLKSCFCHFRAFSIKNPTPNPSKTKSKPLKNRCQKRIVFRHRFLRLSASILEPLGPPRWSQVGSKSVFS